MNGRERYLNGQERYLNGRERYFNGQERLAFKTADRSVPLNRSGQKPFNRSKTVPFRSVPFRSKTVTEKTDQAYY